MINKQFIFKILLLTLHTYIYTYITLNYLINIMFTGIVKLAQIDDYISPSQNCIQPKIIKSQQLQTKATVTLNDCLACSGCITSAESVLVQQMSLEKFKHILKQQTQVYILISPQSLVSLSHYYAIQPLSLFQKLSLFFKNNFLSIKNIFFEAQGIKICHQLIYIQFLTKYQQKSTVICSQCPGWVCYAQKTLNQDITHLMSQVKTPQQIMARLIKQKYGSHIKVISIMPCFDKKLQAIRFNLDQKTKEVDITLATNEVQNLINQFPPNYLNEIEIKKSQMQPQQTGIFLKQNLSTSLRFLQDQASNGYINFLLQKIKAVNIKQKQIKNNDFIEITGQVNGQQIKMAKCYGFRNIQKVVSLIKRKKCEYSYIEMMACPGGCYGGGGQIRFEDKKPKDIFPEFKLMEKPYVEDYSLKQSETEKIQELIKRYDEFSAVYKPIEKSFTSAVMNW